MRRRSRGEAPSTPRPEPVERVIAGRAWLRGELRPVEVGIDARGLICRLARSIPAAGARHDVGDAVLLPSAVDAHVHFRDPGGPSAPESFASGTVQAALGGVGAVADMPNTRPVADSADRLESKAARARGRIAVDVLLYALATTRRRPLGAAGQAGGFKLYMGPTTGIPEPPDDREIPELLERVASTGLALSVHAEAPSAFTVPGAPPESSADWDRARPAPAEQQALDRLLPGPEALRLNVAHVTTAPALQRLSAAGVLGEVTAHHLLLASGPEDRGWLKVNPPLRAEPVRAALWAAFAGGAPVLLASDHAPHFAEEKERPFAQAPSGVPGVETLLPLMLERARAGELALPRLVAAACDRPARHLGLPQGRLAVGHRANLLVVDFRDHRPLAARRLHGPCGWTPFEGREAVFPREHYLDGELLVSGGEFVGASRGRVVRPEYAPGAERLVPAPPPDGPPE